MSETTNGAPATEEWAPLPERRVAVLPHTLSEFDHFDDAVAVIQANGALLVWRWGYDARRGDVPIKGYAPGAWVTYEHLGGGYATPVYPGGKSDLATRPLSHPIDSITELHERLTAEAADEPAPRSHADDPDPFVQLAPEALARENGAITRRSHRRGELRALVQPGGDGDDEAFRRSSDSLPLAEPPDPGTGGPDEPGVGPDSDSRGVARALARLAAQTWDRRWSVRRPTEAHLSIPPVWPDFDRVRTALALILIPVTAFLLAH